VCVISIKTQLSPILGPFWSNDEYLLVADYNQNVYQLKAHSGEVRAIPVNPCRAYTLTVDPSINCLYMTCTEKVLSSGQLHFRIRKKTFDGKINQAIYYAPQGKKL